ncbi:MAG: hypothetical protein IKC80_01475 [Kiritimatiellae bacterium]|nr:hypothetical protein [Kiritimatiellia bacterium]
MTLSGLHTLKTGNGKQVVLVSDSGITLSGVSTFSSLKGGRHYVDFSSGGNGRFGLSDTCELNGRVNVGELVLANNIADFRLDHFASSSNPVRTDDLVLDSIYRGSGHFYVVGPRSAGAHEGSWNVKPGSPYVFRAGTGEVIAPGSVVSCAGVFPEGTFVKRVFPDGSIELSEPASASVEAGEHLLSFAAIKPVARLEIPLLKMNTYTRTYTTFRKIAADDDFVVEVHRLVSSRTLDVEKRYSLFTPNKFKNDGYCPAKIIIHDAAGGGSGTQASDRGFYHQDKYAGALRIELGECHLEFAETGREGALPGFPDSTTVSEPDIGSAVCTRLTVTNNICAYIGNFTNFFHTVEKDGAGTIVLALTNHVEKNTGTLVVKEGEAVLPAGAWVKTVAVSNGATLRISGVFAPGKFVAEAGARVVGEGVLSLPDVSSARGVIFAEGACLQVPGVSELRTEAPATNVPASVAFWVDASRMDTITFADELLTNVVRIADVRGEAYGFATNTLGGYPRLVRDHRGRPHHINLPWVSSAQSQTDPDKCIALIWDKPYTNIRAVFQVLDTRDGGGQFLGMTSRISGNDFMRPAGTDSRTYSAPIFYSKNTGCDEVRSGPFYANGRLYNPDNGYPYPGGGATRNLEDGNAAKWSAPAVFSAHPISNTQADAFAFNAGAGSRSGYHRVCECLIFTNEVTETERLAITGYLMKKWLNHEIDFDAADGNPFPDVDAEKIGGIGVSDGESMYVAKISGAAEFFKKGAGTLYINDYAVAEGSLDVAAGNLTINSRLPPDIADIPEGAYVHFDASDVSTLTVKSSGQVSEWRDIRGEGYHKATHLSSTNNSYATVTATPRGMNAIDFGSYKGREDGWSWSDKHDSPIMKYPACGELHSVFMVMDSSQGGGVLVGCGQDPNLLRGPYCGYGLRRFETIETLSYAAPILTNALINSYGQGQKNLSYEGGSRARLNGQRINPLTTGFSGGWDLVSLVSYEDFGGGSFAAANYNKYVGGQKVGEAILYKEGLSERQVDTVEAYLNWKWFGKATPGFRPAVVSNLTVRAGATLAVSGGQPLTVKGAFSGSGTVQGALVFDGTARFVVAVKDGAVNPVSVSGTVDVSGGGRVLVTGDLSSLKPGDYAILNASSISAADVSRWIVTLDGSLKRRLQCSLTARDGSLVLSVKRYGMTVIAR